MSALAARATRRGACPSLSAPMQTGDGLLVRLAPDTGALTAGQLSGLAELAGEHGNGILEITARGNLQIRGLSEASVLPLAEGVATLGIAPRHGVPVEANPLAGLDPAETADAAPVAKAIREAITTGLAARLGPKVTVVVDGGGRIGLDGLLADVRVAALRREADIAWQISVAGTAASAAPEGIYAEAEVPGAVTRLLAAIAERGRAARGRDLPAARRATSPDDAETSEAPMIGPMLLKNETWALLVALPFGQIASAGLSRLAGVAAEAGAGALRLAPQRRLILTGLSRVALAGLTAAAAEQGLITDPSDRRLRMAACAGAPHCRSAYFDTKALAAALAPLVGESGLHLSGCSKRCAEPTGAMPAIIGISEREAELVSGGTRRRIPLARAADALAGHRQDATRLPHPLSPPADFADTTRLKTMPRP